MYQEFDKYVGSNQIVTLNDKMNLNYINVVVAENQKYCNLVFLNILHKTAKNVNIQEYNFSKSTLITHQIETVMKDERYLKNLNLFQNNF